MKSTLNLVAWAIVAGVIVYLAFNPESGVLYQGPWSALGLSLIGLGMCVEGQKRLKRSGG